jgi:hypothetical protein
MNITNAKYQAQYGENISILLTVGGEERPMTVPLDPANRHYQAILEWVEDGNTIEDAD